MFLIDIFKKKRKVVMGVKVKKLHPKAVIPTYAKHGDAGLDLTATSCRVDKYGNVTYGTGLSFIIPKGWIGVILPCRNISMKNIVLTSSVDIINHQHEGEVVLRFKPLIGVFNDIAIKHKYSIFCDKTNVYKIGEIIGKVIFMPYTQLNLIEE